MRQPPMSTAARRQLLNENGHRPVPVSLAAWSLRFECNQPSGAKRGLRELTLPHEALISGATPRFAPGLGPVARGGT